MISAFMRGKFFHPGQSFITLRFTNTPAEFLAGTSQKVVAICAEIGSERSEVFKVIVGGCRVLAMSLWSQNSPQIGLMAQRKRPDSICDEPKGVTEVNLQLSVVLHELSALKIAPTAFPAATLNESKAIGKKYVGEDFAARTENQL
jgi:hypothetical protein